MAQLDFFAVRQDQLDLLEFLFDSTDVRVMEQASRPDSTLVEFRSAAEVAAAYPLGDDVHGNGLAVTLALWSPSAMSKVHVRRIDFDRARVKDARFRHEPEGGALMQLYFGGLNGHVITKSHFGHNSLARARRWGVDAGISWEALAKVSRRIQYHVRTRLAADKVPGRLVLRHAAALWHQGLLLKESVRSPHYWTRSGLRSDA